MLYKKRNTFLEKKVFGHPSHTISHIYQPQGDNSSSQPTIELKIHGDNEKLYGYAFICT